MENRMKGAERGGVCLWTCVYGHVFLDMYLWTCISRRPNRRAQTGRGGRARARIYIKVWAGRCFVVCVGRVLLRVWGGALLVSAE